MSAGLLQFQSILLPDGWAENMVIEIDSEGNIHAVSPAGDVRKPGVQRIPGWALPGVPNCHSHAHQRAMAGLGEKAGLGRDGRQTPADSFWTWREVMYRYLERIQPEHLYAISRQVYTEMLKAGYTCVGEFQYLHHDPSGRPYSNRAEMTLQCMQAAKDVGIGFTALPVLYRYGGFGNRPPLDGQKRFINDVMAFCEIVHGLVKASADSGNGTVGIAPHSLRAIDEPLLREVLRNLSGTGLAAIHLHIAEQAREVADCLAWSRERPVQWLLNRFDLDSRWCLVHATHMDEEETLGMAKSGAIAGLCPTTEANLGDGFFNLGRYRQHGGQWAIGSDSHISVSPVEELRWLEYGQRLRYRQRNMVSGPSSPHTGKTLLTSAVRGGSRACGRKTGRIERGYRADFIVLDAEHSRLVGRTGDERIDSWIFSGNENPLTDVFVGGRQVISGGHHNQEESIRDAFSHTLRELSA
ncbi:MAG: formimidoylglutamate deiminase [Gammaproteobacteria bacterium]|nr:formimidoylglutamate deiminase [Gammaproteobacteria bacterium]